MPIYNYRSTPDDWVIYIQTSGIFIDLFFLLSNLKGLICLLLYSGVIIIKICDNKSLIPGIKDRISYDVFKTIDLFKQTQKKNYHFHEVINIKLMLRSKLFVEKDR